MSEDDDTLELTRQIGEAFSLGEGVTVRFLGIQGARVRLGIEAPRSVAVKRAEASAGGAGRAPAQAGTRDEAGDE